METTNKTEMEKTELALRASEYARDQTQAQLNEAVRLLAEMKELLASKKTVKAQKAVSAFSLLKPSVQLDAQVSANVKKAQEWVHSKFGTNAVSIEASTYTRKDSKEIPCAHVKFENGEVYLVSSMRFWKVK